MKTVCAGHEKFDEAGQLRLALNGSITDRSVSYYASMKILERTGGRCSPQDRFPSLELWAVEIDAQWCTQSSESMTSRSPLAWTPTGAGFRVRRFLSSGRPTATLAFAAPWSPWNDVWSALHEVRTMPDSLGDYAPSNEDLLYTAPVRRIWLRAIWPELALDIHRAAVGTDVQVAEVDNENKDTVWRLWRTAGPFTPFFRRGLRWCWLRLPFSVAQSIPDCNSDKRTHRVLALSSPPTFDSLFAQRLQLHKWWQRQVGHRCSLVAPVELNGKMARVPHFLRIAHNAALAREWNILVEELRAIFAPSLRVVPRPPTLPFDGLDKWECKPSELLQTSLEQQQAILDFSCGSGMNSPKGTTSARREVA